MLFTVGDRVTWISQAGGFEKQKTGEVIAVVPANEEVTGEDARKQGRHLWDLCEKYQARSRYGGGMSRPHQSYLVLVREGKKKPMIYWPLVRQLGKAISQTV